MLVLLGKSCSGKSTIQKELVRLGVTPILEYTTRPPRENEKEGKQYHFVTERKFWDMIFNISKKQIRAEIVFLFRLFFSIIHLLKI